MSQPAAPSKKNAVVTVFAAMGIVAVVTALAWAGYQRYGFEKQKQALLHQSDRLCASMAIRFVKDIKTGVQMLQQMPGNTTKISGSLVVTSPEIDAEIEKSFAGRDLREAGLGSKEGDYDKIDAILKSIQTRSPETAAQCKKWAAAMESCLPGFPYLNMEPGPECKEKHVKPAVDELTKYLQRNYKIEEASPTK